jgi:starvation-inducible outer membrane lipoprotein
MRTLLALALVLAAGTQITDVLKDPKAFDKKTVTVEGKVDEFEQKTSKIGNKYAKFRILQGERWLNVYAKGEIKPPLKEGDKVTVKGKFAAEKKVGKSTFKNEIELNLKDKEAIQRG